MWWTWCLLLLWLRLVSYFIALSVPSRLFLFFFYSFSQRVTLLVWLLEFSCHLKLRSEALWKCHEQRGRCCGMTAAVCLSSFLVWKRVSGCCFRSLTASRCTAVRLWHAHCIKILLFHYLAVTVSWHSGTVSIPSVTHRPQITTVAQLERII